MGETRKRPALTEEGLPANWREWPTLGEAAALLGVKRHTLTRLIGLGVVKKLSAPNTTGGGVGSYRIDPNDIPLLEEYLEDESQKEAAPTTSDVVRASVEAQKAATAHTERLVTLFETPYKYVVDALRQENTALREELKTMREERKALEQMREEFRSAHAAEAIALEEVRGDQETKRVALEMAKKLGSHFMTKGLDPKLVILKDAVDSIPRESFELLFHMGVLPKDVEAKLKLGLDWQDAPAPAPANGAASA